MKLMKWKRDEVKDPIVELYDRMNDLFDSFMGKSPISLFEKKWNPSVDITEDDDKIYVKADLPGVDEKDIEVTLQDNVLTIKGERKEEKVDKKKKEHRVERFYGSFQRSFTLPAEIVADSIKAKFKKGVLEIEIPKDKSKAPKQIKVNVE